MERTLALSRTMIGLMAVALAAYFVASGVGSFSSLGLIEPSVAAVYQPIPEPEPSQIFSPRSGQDVCNRNVFDFTHRPCEQPLEPSPPEPGNTSLPRHCGSEYELVGTVASESGISSLALVRQNQEITMVGIGETLDGVGFVSRIGWRLVLVEDGAGNGCLLDLYGEPQNIPSGPPQLSKSQGDPPGIDGAIQVISPMSRRVSKLFVEDLLENPGKLLTPSLGRAVMHRDAGQMKGFRLVGVRSTSLLARLGLRSGDIINAVNDYEMTSIDRPIEALTALRRSESLSVTITRSGRREVLNLEFF